MQVVVDFDRCQSNAICMQHAPEVFEVRDDGFLYILDEHPPEDLRSRIKDAVRYCPTMAISIVEAVKAVEAVEDKG
ncbi:MAG: ferredoxin [Acidimicrobiales bacterium]